MEFTFDTQGNNSFFICNLSEGEELDRMGLGMLENNRLEHILPVSYMQQDDARSLRVNISSLVPLETLLTRPVNREKHFNVLQGICKALLAVEEYLLNEKHFLMDKKYIYCNMSNGKTSMIYLPLLKDISEMSFTGLIKSIMQGVQYASSGDMGYVPPLLNYINSKEELYPADLLEFLKTVDLQTSNQSSSGYVQNLQTIIQPQQSYVQNSQPLQSQQNFMQSQQVVQRQMYLQDPQPMQPQQQMYAQNQQPVQTQFYMQNQQAVQQQNYVQNPQPIQRQEFFQNQQPMQQYSGQGQQISQGYATNKPIQNRQDGRSYVGETQQEDTVESEKKTSKKKKRLFSLGRRSEEKKAKEEKKSQSFAIPGRETQASEEQMREMKASSIGKGSGYWQDSSQAGNQQNFQANSVLNRTFGGANQVFGGTNSGVGLQNSQSVVYSQQERNDYANNGFVAGYGQNYSNNDQYAQFASASTDTVSLQKKGNGKTEEDPTMPLIRARNGGAPSLVVTLRRNRTNEEVRIDKPYFLVGKDPNADFVITGNNTISKSHLSITTRDGRFFVTDTNSLNHTFLNNNQLISSREYELHSGDLLVLSDEPFEFHVR